MISKIRGRWRHFTPRRRHTPHTRGEFCIGDCVASNDSGEDIFAAAAERVKSTLQRRPEVQDLDRKIDKFRVQARRTHIASDWLAALYAQAPRAVIAQLQMDRSPRGYQNKQARVLELIDFNDTFVEAVLAMNTRERCEFVKKAKQGCDYICKLVNSPVFSDEQWEAIYRGLSREIAVYLAAQNNGFYTYMTSRNQDAMGIDMQIKDPEEGLYINIDIKSPSAFRHRLEDLVKEGRLTAKELLQADERSYALVTNGHGKNATQVVILCILPDRFGEIENFVFRDDNALRDMLNALISKHGLRDGHYGVFGSLAVARA